MSEDLFAQLDDYTLDLILHAIGEFDVFARITLRSLRSTCRRFAALISPNISRVNYGALCMHLCASYCPDILAQIVRESDVHYSSLDRARFNRARIEVRTRWPDIIRLCLHTIDGRCATILRDAYVSDFALETVIDPNALVMAEYQVNDNILHMICAWGIDETKHFLAPYITDESARFIAEDVYKNPLESWHHRALEEIPQVQCELCNAFVLYYYALHQVSFRDYGRGKTVIFRRPYSSDQSMNAKIIQIHRKIIDDDIVPAQWEHERLARMSIPHITDNSPIELFSAKFAAQYRGEKSQHYFAEQMMHLFNDGNLSNITKFTYDVTNRQWITHILAQNDADTERMRRFLRGDDTYAFVYRYLRDKTTTHLFARTSVRPISPHDTLIILQTAFAIMDPQEFRTFLRELGHTFTVNGHVIAQVLQLFARVASSRRTLCLYPSANARELVAFYSHKIDLKYFVVTFDNKHGASLCEFAQTLKDIGVRIKS